MPRALTTRAIATLKPGPIRQEIPDRFLPNLYLILQPSGARGWAVRYRVGGRSRKYTIGPYPAVDLKAARDLGAKALRAVAEGRDPSREKVLARLALPDTVAATVTQFMELHCRRKNKARTIVGNQRLFNRHILPRWQSRPVKSITRREVRELVDAVVASGSPVAANRVLTLLKTLFAWALERDIVEASPCAAVKLPTIERPRDRVLTDSELGDIWRAIDRIGGPYAAAVKLLALTGQRRGEVVGMTWGELDLPARLWKLPKERTKNGKPHDVPLSDPALAILAGLPRLGDFVITFSGTAPANSFAKFRTRLDVLLPPGMPPWRLHDLRRTCASGMARLGVSLPVSEKCLNHVSGSFAGIVGVYQHHDYESEKREALKCWAAHVLALNQVERLSPRVLADGDLGIQP